jgi:hypothetical protein
MSQIFHRSTNTLSRATIFGAVFVLAALGWMATEIQRSPYVTYAGVRKPQPVPFSHQHHVSGLGIDCRYCHTSVEKSSFAGVPPTQTCMTCHSQIWTNASLLEPVRASYRDNKSLPWVRVNALPDFVYFDHSIHVSKGIGCTTCHGPVGDMALTYRAGTLYMSWCLACHRQPEKNLRPKAEVFNAFYQPPSSGHPVEYEGVTYTNQLKLGAQLSQEYKILPLKTMQSCSTCHR